MSSEKPAPLAPRVAVRPRRLPKAAPLLLVGGICLGLTVWLLSWDGTAGTGRLPVWVLFLGMGVISLSGAGATFAFPAPAPRRAPQLRPAVLPPVEEEPAEEAEVKAPRREMPEPPRPTPPALFRSRTRLPPPAAGEAGPVDGAGGATVEPSAESGGATSLGRAATRPMQPDGAVTTVTGSGGLGTGDTTTCASCGRTLPAREAWRRCRSCGKTLCVACLTESVRAYGSGYCRSCSGQPA